MGMKKQKDKENGVIFEIETVQQYLLSIMPFQQRTLAQIHRFGVDRPAVLFRGQKANQLLVAKIARFCETNDLERKLGFEKARHALLKQRLNMSLSDWDIIALEQHHGIATRFLDWTSNALTALWFALGKNDSSYEETGASNVWVLETVNSDFDIPCDEQSPIPSEKGSRTVIFTPRMMDCRIAAQDSYLMRQVYERTDPNKSKRLSIIPVDENPTFSGRVHRLHITANNATRDFLLEELSHYGYSSKSILPDSHDWSELVEECDSLAPLFKGARTGVKPCP